MSILPPKTTAIITGAASGIGLSLTTTLAAAGQNLLLIDLDTTPLTSLAAAHPHLQIVLCPGDVASPSTWKTALSQLPATPVTGLFLNAGRAVPGQKGVTDIEAFEKTFETNVGGVVKGLNAFLPKLVESDKEGLVTRLVITGSKQGITNPPGNPSYNASKAAVKSIAEGTAVELEKMGAKTTVHLLIPGWTFTGMTGSRQTTEKPAGAWWPQQVVDYLFEKIAKKSFYVVCPDNEVDEETDKKRMAWAQGDVIYDRPALSRWRQETKESAATEISKLEI